MFRVSAKTDYAIRALVELARARPGPVKADVLATEQHIPRRYLETTLGELRVAGLVRTRRGADGGYWLASPPDDITIASIIVALEGALMDVRAVPVDGQDDVAASLSEVWGSAESALAEVLQKVTLADVMDGSIVLSTDLADQQ